MAKLTTLNLNSLARSAGGKWSIPPTLLSHRSPVDKVRLTAALDKYEAELLYVLSILESGRLAETVAKGRQRRSHPRARTLREYPVQIVVDEGLATSLTADETAVFIGLVQKKMANLEAVRTYLAVTPEVQQAVTREEIETVAPGILTNLRHLLSKGVGKLVLGVGLLGGAVAAPVVAAPGDAPVSQRQTHNVQRLDTLAAAPQISGVELVSEAEINKPCYLHITVNDADANDVLFWSVTPDSASAASTTVTPASGQVVISPDSPRPIVIETSVLCTEARAVNLAVTVQDQASQTATMNKEYTVHYPSADLRRDTSLMGKVLTLGRQLNLQVVNGQLVEELTTTQETTAYNAIKNWGIDPYKENIIADGYRLRMFKNSVDNRYYIAWTSPVGEEAETALDTSNESTARKEFYLTVFSNAFGLMVPGDVTGNKRVGTDDSYLLRAVQAENFSARDLTRPDNQDMDGDGRLTVVDTVVSSIKQVNATAPTRYNKSATTKVDTPVFIDLTQYAQTANNDVANPLFVELGTPSSGTVTWNSYPFGFYYTPAEGFTGTVTIPVMTANPYSSTVVLGQQKITIEAENHAPVIENLKATPNPVGSDDQTTITFTANDLDSNQKLSWTAVLENGNGGSLDVTSGTNVSPGATISIHFDTGLPTNATVRVTVNDNAGGNAESSVDIWVQ